MRRTPVGSTIALVLLSTVALSLVVNVASAELPEALSPYRWLAWPLLFVLAGAVIVVTVRADRPGRAASGDPAGSRRDLIDAQRDSWITGVLKQSLYAKARLRLAFTTTVDEPHPWGVKVIAPETSARRLGAETVAEVFDTEMRGRMLILGAPGAGKTTTLLELLDELLDRAEADPEAPVPLMVNLAAWNDSLDLGAWTVRETARRYRVPADHLSTWLDTARLVLLLDGLDEVPERHRPSCLRAINALRETHPNLRLIVCCRSEEFRALGEKHALRGRVEIQPLTSRDVDRFLRKHRLDAARRILAEDAELRAMVTTPLLLSVLTLAHQDNGTAVEEAGRPLERLFTAYVRRMLVQRVGPGHPAAHVVAQLGFIAAYIKHNERTVFSFDIVHGDWLARVPLLGWRAVVYAPVLLSAGWWWAGPWGAGLAAITLLTLMLPYAERNDGWTLEPPEDHDRAGYRSAFRPRPVVDLVEGLLEATGDRFWMGPALGLASLAGVITGAVYPVWTGVWYGTGAFLAMWIAVGVIMNDQTEYAVPRNTRTECPSPQVHAARLASARYALVAALTAFAVVLLVTTWSTGLVTSVPFATLAAVSVACFVHFNLAGYAIAEQRTTRRRLRRAGLLDYPARPLLDHAADCLLLQRLGDDYLFPHLLLRDYFAELWSVNGIGDVTMLYRERLNAITRGLD